MANNIRNLGRVNKIKHIMVQRRFLEAIYERSAHEPDFSGDPTFRYTGHLFPENVKWLKENGIDVYDLRATDPAADNYGHEVYILTPSKNIELTDEEMAEATATFDEILKKATAGAIDMMEELMARFGDECDDDDDGDDDDEYGDEDDGDEKHTCTCGCCCNTAEGGAPESAETSQAPANENGDGEGTVPPPYSV